MTDEETKKLLEGFANALEVGLNADPKEPMGFVLIVFPFESSGGRVDCISNVNTESIPRASRSPRQAPEEQDPAS